jgi:hypothetical protein
MNVMNNNINVMNNQMKNMNMGNQIPGVNQVVSPVTKNLNVNNLLMENDNILNNNININANANKNVSNGFIHQNTFSISNQNGFNNRVPNAVPRTTITSQNIMMNK